MPAYDFEDTKTGERVELWMSADEAVEIGKTVRRGGRRLRRLASGAQGMVEPGWNHVTHQFTDEDCAKYGPKDRLGRPRALTEHGGLPLTGRKEIAEMQARMAADGRTMGYDFGQFRK